MKGENKVFLLNILYMSDKIILLCYLLRRKLAKWSGASDNKIEMVITIAVNSYK